MSFHIHLHNDVKQDPSVKKPLVDKRSHYQNISLAFHGNSSDDLTVDHSVQYLVQEEQEKPDPATHSKKWVKTADTMPLSEKIREQRLLGFFNEVGAGFYNLPKVGPSILTLSYLPVIAYIGLHVAHDAKETKEQYGHKAGAGRFVIELLKHLTTSVFLPTTLVFTGARTTEVIMRKLEELKALKKPLEKINSTALMQKMAVYPNDRPDTFKTLLKEIAPQFGVSDQVIQTVIKDLPHKQQEAWLPVVRDILNKNKLISGELIDVVNKFDQTNLKMPKGIIGTITKPFEIISIPMERLVEFIFNSLHKGIKQTKNESWTHAINPMGDNIKEALYQSVKEGKKISSRRGLTSVAMTIGGITSLLSLYKYTDWFGEKLIDHIVVPLVSIVTPEVKHSLKPHHNPESNKTI